MDRTTFQKVVQLVQEGYQVMVFVHARKETVKAALALKEAAMIDGSIDDFSCADDPKWDFYRRDIGQSRNKEMKELFDSGFGIHHAGMLRSDRNLTERLFLEKAIKVPSTSVASRSFLLPFLPFVGPLLHCNACMGCQPSRARRSVSFQRESQQVTRMR